MALFNTGYKEYSQKSDYSQIKNLEQLKEAQNSLSNKIIKKEMELNYKFNDFKELFNPLTYVHKAVEKIASLEAIFLSFYKGYTTFRDKFWGRRGEKEDSISGNEQSDAPVDGSNEEIRSV